MSTLRQLKVFVTTAEHKKMSEAAKHLYISQPTISQIIADLEKEYDVALFERHARELRLTAAGVTLLESAKRIVSINESLIQNMKNIHAIRPLRIGATMTIGTNITAKIIRQLETLFPDIDSSVVITNTAQIEKMLLHNELDVALVEGIITRSEILSKPAFVDELCLLCSVDHPLAHKEVITVEDLQGQTFLLREKGSGTRALFESLMQSHHITYKVKWESTSTPAIVDAVTENLGLGFVSCRCAKEKAEKGVVRLCTVRGLNLHRFFYLCHLKKHPATTQFSDFIHFIESLPQDFQ